MFLGDRLATQKKRDEGIKKKMDESDWKGEGKKDEKEEVKNFCPFIEQFINSRRRKKLKNERMNVEELVERDFGLLMKFFSFLIEEKGVKMINESFFDERREGILDDYIESLIKTIHDAYFLQLCCYILEEFFRYCSYKRGVRKNEKRKCHAFALWRDATEEKERWFKRNLRQAERRGEERRAMRRQTENMEGSKRHKEVDSEEDELKKEKKVEFEEFKELKEFEDFKELKDFEEFEKVQLKEFEEIEETEQVGKTKKRERGEVEGEWKKRRREKEKEKREEGWEAEEEEIISLFLPFKLAEKSPQLERVERVEVRPQVVNREQVESEAKEKEEKDGWEELFLEYEKSFIENEEKENKK